MQHRSKSKTDRFHTLVFSIVLLFAAAPLLWTAPRAFAVTAVQSRFDKVSDPGANAAATHLVGFTYTDFATPVGSVQLEFCSNSPIIGDPCTSPAGFDLTSVALGAQTGESGFTIHANSTASTLILTRPAALPTQGASTYTLNNVINPSAIGTYYLRIQTFTATDATGLGVQEGGVALSVNGPVTISTEVPPHLEFCVSVLITSFDCSSANSFFIDMGELSTTQTKTGSSQMVADTNAAFGYSIFATGTTFTSGNNTIPASIVPTVTNIGLSQFGINLRANGQPNMGDEPVGPGQATVTANYNIPNKFMYQSGDSVASGTVSQDYRKFTVTYIVNVSTAQPAGIYTTTFTYICLANF